MRKALIVGIDYYSHLSPLKGCVSDAYAVKNALERHHDGTVNFVAPKLMVSGDLIDMIDRDTLRSAVDELFKDDSDIALLYFAGHGYVDGAGGFLCAGDCKQGHDGLSLAEVMAFANESKAKNKIIILDSCYGGSIASKGQSSGFSEIKDGMTILTASTEQQPAKERKTGVFTELFVDALGGAAANLVGDVTPGSVYAHIDQSLGPWGGQRPVFKTNVKTFVSLRKANPPIPTESLRELTKLFPTEGFIFELDPSFEPERNREQLRDKNFPKPNPANNAKFALLQKFVKVNLVTPVDAPHMWHAAMRSKACKLTVLGEHYRNLVEQGLI